MLAYLYSAMSVHQAINDANMAKLQHYDEMYQQMAEVRRKQGRQCLDELSRRIAETTCSWCASPHSKECCPNCGGPRESV